ncbi:Protein CBG24021 [Caenorhabditis briggsae]|uniref:Protein CBG24021 n=1 Tax=Caenorhabditis briggsae TaxID=6238 RepID=A8WJT5_CAEBR|nr:Protein CBG24021 [Caenorhabditis briggsae]CAP20728.1 Protein CBG24021 [Caenorhabditis briggsae]
MVSVVEIYDPKKRNDIVQGFLKNRKEHKIKNLQERSDLEHIEDHRIDVFKPILESNKKLQEEIIDEKNKIVETLNNFKVPTQLSIAPSKTTAPSTSKLPILQKKSLDTIQKETPSLPSSSSNLVVSNLIVSYLQDGSDRSNAGYSIKFNKDEKKYTIGNKGITFDQNILKVNNEEYTATEGLMELLIKKSPDLKKIQSDDISNYQKILFCSNALYQGFDNTSKKYNSDSSDKWKFIKKHYFVTKDKNTSTVDGSSIKPSFNFIPSDTNSLINSLRLSIASFQAGNNGEYNKINAILDELVRQKKIRKKDLGVIYLNIEMFPDIGKSIDQLSIYTKSEITRETAIQYINSCESIYNSIDAIKADDRSKNELKKAMTFLVSQIGMNECIKEVLNAASIENVQLKRLLNEERCNYNKLAKKYKEEQKSEQVEIPKLSLSITRNNRRNAITNEEIINIANNINTDELANTNLTRVSAAGVKNVKTVYAKKNETGLVVNQK